MLKAKEPGAMPSGTESDDVRLVSLVASGDLWAFETLYRRYFPRITRFLDRVTRRPHLVGEIVNDTMLVVWQKAHTFNLSCKVSTWIFAIAYRKALKANRLVDDPAECDFDRYPDEAAHEPENIARLHELQVILLRALDALTVDQRAVVCLTYFNGLDYGEIAEIMECPVNTIKTRMFHARRRLETLLISRKKEIE